MRHLELDLEEWQEAALEQIARASGVTADAAARSLLSDSLFARTCGTLLDWRAAPGCAPNCDVRKADTLEARLQSVFES